MPDIKALPPDLLTAMVGQEQCSGVVAVYQATVNQRLTSHHAPIERSLWINPRQQKPDDIRMLLLLLLLQEGLIGDDATRNELELWAIGYLRSRFPSALRRVSDDTVYKVLLRLQRDFVYAEDWRAFLKYAKQVMRGVLAEERQEQAGRGKARPGDQLIQQVATRLEAEGFSISEQTLYRWKAKGSLCGQNPEDLLVQARTVAEPKCRRAKLRKEGKTRGLSDDNLKKLFQRKKRPDGTPDFEAIEKHIKRHDKVAEAMAASEDALSLEAQIVAWEERKAEAPPGSDQWCEAQDALQRLQQPQQDTHP